MVLEESDQWGKYEQSMNEAAEAGDVGKLINYRNRIVESAQTRRDIELGKVEPYSRKKHLKEREEIECRGALDNIETCLRWIEVYRTGSDSYRALMDTARNNSWKMTDDEKKNSSRF
jgi:hypothetical protein